MSTLGWILIAAAAWTGVGVLVGVLVGRIIRMRDFEVEAEVQIQMDGLDDELAELLGGGSR